MYLPKLFKKILPFALSTVMVLQPLQSTAYAAESVKAEDQAAVPKSLSFNSPDTKMTVGESQQLDVKVTKSQPEDNICLGYRIDAGDDILSVTDTGYLTALNKGKATVTVYPAEKSGNTKTEIEGAKTASVKITVNGVTAPKIVSLTGYDTYINVRYSLVSDGCRREIYVLEGKNKKAADFETKIAAMKNGAWKAQGFAVAPVYMTDDEEADCLYANDKGTQYVSYNISGLNVQKDYTIYIRNVSEGVNNTITSSAGSVKSVKTAKKQVYSIDLTVENAAQSSALSADSDGNYSIKLSEKTVHIAAKGKYNGSSNKEGYDLPLTNELQSDYENPKLQYYVYSGKNISGAGTSKCDIASIDNKGNLKFTGAGTVTVAVCDKITGTCGYATVNAVAESDSIKGKNAKLKTGQYVMLSDILDYKCGNAKVTGSFAKSLKVSDAESLNNEYFDLIPCTNSDNGYQVNDYYVVAKKKGTATITVKDELVKDSEATVKLQITGIEPAKNVKVQEVTDSSFKLAFSYALKSDYSKNSGNDMIKVGGSSFADKLGFKIEVTDSSNNVIKNSVVTLKDILNGNCKYTSEAGLYRFVYPVSGLSSLSSYKVSVTAVYGSDTVSKAATVKAKTTNVPASYVDVDSDYGKNSDGGMEVYADKTALSSYNALTSTNTYTLKAGSLGESANKTADTLIWKSTDTKVVTLKADAGTYTATLNALKKGTAKIEITSKTTKKVIARWTVFVNAVSENEAGNSTENGTPEELSVTKAVSAKLGQGESKKAVFAAPAHGNYTISVKNGSMIVSDNNGARKTNYVGSYSCELQENEKIFVEFANTDSKKAVNVSVSISDYEIKQPETTPEDTPETEPEPGNKDDTEVVPTPDDTDDTGDKDDTGETPTPDDKGDTDDNGDAGETPTPDDTGDTPKPDDKGDTDDNGDAGETPTPDDTGDGDDTGETPTPEEKPREAIELKLTSFDDMTEISISGQGYTYLKLTSQAAGRYVLALSEGYRVYKSSELNGEYTELEEYYCNAGIYSRSFYMNENETAYIALYYPSYTTITEKASFSAVEVAELKEGGIAVTKVFNAYDQNWIKITASVSGRYTIKLDAKMDNIYLYSSLDASKDYTLGTSDYYNETGADGSTHKVYYNSTYLEAGQTIYANLFVDSDKEQTVNVSLDTIAVPTELTLDAADISLPLRDTGENWVKITAPSSGRYMLKFGRRCTAKKYSSMKLESSTAWVRSTGTHNIDSQESYASYYVAYMEAGETAYIKISATGKEETNVRFKTIDVTDITIDAAPISKALDGMSQNWLEVTASKEGNYNLRLTKKYSHVYTYPSIDLDDKSGTELECTNDKQQYLYQFSMKAGETLYIQIDDTDRGSASVSIETAAADEETN